MTKKKQKAAPAGDSTSAPPSPPDPPPTAPSRYTRAKARLAELLDNFHVRLALRITYVLLSSYGAFSFIREYPERIFYGFNALAIVIGFLFNALLALTVSDREIKIVWVTLRSFSTWRFLYAFYQVYPTHSYRLLSIGSIAALYGYFAPWDRTATIALLASLVLVGSDTPKFRRLVWEGENSRIVQIGLAACAGIFLGGFRVYRWAALIGLYLAQNVLLGATDFSSSSGQGELHQVWIASASIPSLVIYNLASERGLSTWTSFLYTISHLLILRPNAPGEDLKLVRTLAVCASGILLELHLFGIGGRFGFLLLSTLAYVLTI